MIQTRAPPQGQQSTVRTFAGYAAVRYRMTLARYVKQEGTGKTTKMHRGLSPDVLLWSFFAFRKALKKKIPPDPQRSVNSY